MSSASKKLIQASGAVAGPVDTGDDDFANVVLLLDGDGTSGDDNNTFTDSSTNGFTVTENGSVVQGSFSPYGDNWSNYFDGSGDYITTPASSDFNYGYGDYCLEGWLNVSSDATLYSYWMAPISTGGDGNTETDAVSIYIGDGNSGSSVAGEVTVIVCNNAFRLYGGTDIRGQWTHVAVTRESGTTRLFVNGQVTDSSTTSYNITNPADVGAYLGLTKNQTSYFKGHISNVRSVKGSAVYTSAFTPSTAPLTAISGTSLLTCQSNRFVDESTNNYTVTVNGDTKVTPFSPFKDDDARDITTDGGSGYKGGSSTSDYLVTQDALSISDSSNWTAECWVYLSTNSTRQNFFLVADAGETVGNQKDFQFEVSTSGKLTVRGGNGTSTFAISETNDAILGAWTHIAAVQNSGTITFYVNGSSVGTASLTPASIGGTRPAFLFRNSAATSPMIDGYIADARIVVGSSVYTTAFTPPTAPLTAISNTELLLNFQDAGIYDLAGINNIDTVGNASLGFAPVYGTGSLEFDGSGDYLSIVPSPNLDFSTGDFTIEGWFYKTATTANQTIVSSGSYYTSGANGNWVLRITSATQIAFASYDGQSNQEYAEFSAATSLNTWHHFALVREGTGTNQTKFYLDGTLAGSMTVSKSLSDGSVNGIYIGSDGAGPNADFNGYLDDFRITNGVARYTANFTPPTEIDLALDTHAENVVLFLDGDGTPNGQNNTFTDSSTNGFTVTESGSVVQGVFSPYGDNWSNYFDGSSTLLDVSGHAGLNFGSGNFTLECFVSLNSNGSTYQAIIDPRSSASDNSAGLWIRNTGVVYYYAGGTTQILGTTVLNTNQWYHIALVKNSGTTTLYLDGSSEGSFSDSLTYIEPTTFRIGQRYTSTPYNLDGYLSNLRVLKGTAVYTSAFTPPTDPLTAITNTQLLTCQSNRFVDNSTNNSTITISGTPKVTRFSPFESNKPYDITTDGGSGYFNTNNYLTTSNVAFGTNNFTIEAWVYFDDASATQNPIIVLGTDGYNDWQLDTASSKIRFQHTSGNFSGATTLQDNSWYHVAVVREGTGTNQIKIYLNGEVDATSTVSENFDGTGGIRVGINRGSSYYLDGYLSDTRVVNGTAVYTTTFTPPTAPLTAVTNTELLLNFQDSAIPDLSGLNNIDTVGNAKVGASDPTKYGSNAMEFDGSGDRLDAIPTEALVLGTGDFTMETWVNISSFSNYGHFGSTYSGSPTAGTWFFRLYSTTAKWMWQNGSNSSATNYKSYISSTNLTAGQWHHLAVVRQNGVTRLYQDGVDVGGGVDVENLIAPVFTMGAATNGYPLNGYLDDFRITKGIARYTANFTPPTAALPKF